MDLSGFTPNAGFGGNLNSGPAVASAPPQPRSSGILSRIISGVTAAPKYFAEQDIINPTKDIAATLSGNEVAKANVQKDREQLNGNNVGEATKRLAGNTAQLASLVLAPEVKAVQGGKIAAVGAKAAAGAKAGVAAGAGSAAANDQNILKGAVEGGVTGGIAAPVASGVLSKVLPKGTPAEAAQTIESDKPGIAANINNHLQQTEAAAGGFNAGAKLPGSGPSGIDLNESQRLSNLAQIHGIPAGSPATRLQVLQGKLNDATTDLHNTIADNNVPVSNADKQNIVDEYNGRIQEQPNAKELQSRANDLAEHLTGSQESGATLNGEPINPILAKQLGLNTSTESPVNDLKTLNGYRQKLDGIINYSRAQGSPNPVGEQAATILRQTISDHIGNMSPEVSAANKTYSELKALEAPALQANDKIQNQSGGLYNRLLNNGITKGIEAKVSNVGQRLTGGIAPKVPDAAAATAPSVAPTPGVFGQVLSNPAVQTAGTTAATVGPAAAIANPPANQSASSIPVAPGESSGTDVLGLGSPSTEDTLGLNGASAATASDTTDPFSQDSIKAAILKDIQTTGGKNVAALTSLYNTFGKESATQSTAEKNTTDTLNSALATLSTYNDQLNESGGGRGKVGGDFYNDLGAIPVIGGGKTATEVRSIESQKTDVATSIAKALTGGKPSSAQIKSWENAIPNVTDSPTVAKQKMANITASIQAKLATVPGGTQ